jgi:hypothetical protein
LRCVLSRPVVSCRVLSCPVVSCRVLSSSVVSCRFLPFPVVFCRVLSFSVVFCCVAHGAWRAEAWGVAFNRAACWRQPVDSVSQYYTAETAKLYRVHPLTGSGASVSVYALVAALCTVVLWLPIGSVRHTRLVGQCRIVVNLSAVLFVCLFVCLFV